MKEFDLPPAMSSLAAVILSGGQGLRMDGADKGLIEYQGEMLVGRMLEKVQPLAGITLISCNRNEETYQRFGCPLVQDASDDYAGPLAGILAAMQALPDSFSHLLIVPCDTPDLPAEALQGLVDSAEKHPDKVVLLQAQGRPQFLHAVIPVALRQDLQAWLAEGGRAVYKWYQRFELHLLDGEAWADGMLNLNSSKQLKN